MEDIDSSLTKAQRRNLKKEQREREKERTRAERRRKRIIRKIRNYGITVLIILAVIGFFYWRSIPPKDAPLMELKPTSYSFGTVSQAGGIVSGLLALTNAGKSDLIINKMESNCGCTSASLIVDGVEGPRFGMHNNPTDWSATIAPGQTAQLKTYYNPNVHKELRGPVTRTVAIYSNDPHSPKQVRIDAFQTD